MSKKKEKDAHDLVMLHSPTEDGQGMRAIRSRPGRVDFAELRPVEEGKDVSRSELVNLRPRKETPFICDVDVMYAPKQEKSVESSSTGRSGPAYVSNDTYRINWERVFNSRNKKKQLLN